MAHKAADAGQPGLSDKLNRYKPSILFVGHNANSANQDQTPHSAASGQGLHYLITEFSIEI